MQLFVEARYYVAEGNRLERLHRAWYFEKVINIGHKFGSRILSHVASRNTFLGWK
jgi:hypothetical protein